MRRNLEAKLAILEAQDVTIVDRRLTYFDEAVDVNRICGGAVLFPGTRLVGARTFVGPRAKVGIEELSPNFGDGRAGQAAAVMG
jgi:hypothetical protein